MSALYTADYGTNKHKSSISQFSLLAYRSCMLNLDSSRNKNDIISFLHPLQCLWQAPLNKR